MVREKITLTSLIIVVSVIFLLSKDCQEDKEKPKQMH